METQPIVINGKPFIAKEFLLEDYPACMEAFGLMRDRAKVAEGFRTILAKCSDVPEEDAKGCTWKEMLAASAIIQEINGLVPSPKAEAGGPATQVMKDTTSEAAPDSSDTSQESA